MGILSVILASQLAISSASVQTEISKNAEISKGTPKDTIVDTVYIDIPKAAPKRESIPWNRDFDPSRLVRHPTFDSALTVGYSYSASFIGGSYGSFAQQSYMAHFAYEFSENLHLYANLGLWMPLYNNFKGTIAKEDLRQGKVEVVVPDILLEYKPSDNTRVRLMLVNENDAIKAYGPQWYYRDNCPPWRNSIFCN